MNLPSAPGQYDETDQNLTRAALQREDGKNHKIGRPVQLYSSTVANLPPPTIAQVMFASNGRKNGEGAGSGTGVMVFADGAHWIACDTGATVAA